MKLLHTIASLFKPKSVDSRGAPPEPERDNCQRRILARNGHAMVVHCKDDRFLVTDGVSRNWLHREERWQKEFNSEVGDINSFRLAVKHLAIASNVP